MDLAEHSIHAWLAKNSFKTSSGQPFSLRDHLFWFDILSDDHPRQVWLKAPQVGGTEAALIKSTYKAHKKKMNILYTMPTQEDVRLLVKGKLNPMIDNNPCLKDIFDASDTLDFKRAGQANYYFKGTMTERAALSFTVDWVINDEEDRGDQFVTEQYTSRVEFSKYKWELHFSNPSLEGSGVSKYWERSDKRHWFITCASCKKKQFLSWPDSVDIERQEYVCKHCNAILSDEERRVGEWHAMKTDYEPTYRGYWVSLLMCPWIPASRVVEHYRNKTEEYFYNFVLGLPYVGGGNKVTAEMIFKNLTDSVHPQDGTIIIGADTGLTTWYTIGNEKGIFHYGKCEGYNEIEGFLRRWPNSIVVFDAQGDLVKPRELQRKYPGRIFLCFFNEDQHSMQLVRWGEKEEFGMVKADRHRMIQHLADELSDGKLPLYGTREDWLPYTLHWANAYRVTKEDARGREKKMWVTKKPDHWIFSTLYCRIGIDRFCGSDGEVLTGDSLTDEMATAVEVTPDGMMDMRQLLVEKEDFYDDSSD